MSKKALGKGLDALLSPKPEKIRNPENDQEEDNKIEEIANKGVRFIEIKNVRPNPDQPRKEFREESLKELADSIKEKGIIQPIIAERADNETYRIVAGERRFRAAKLAGLVDIPVIIKSFTREEKLEIALIENIQRDDLNPLEEAEAYQHLMNRAGLNQEEVAKKVGKQRSTVANSLRLLKMPDSMRQALREGSLTAGHARAVLSVINPAEQTVLFNRIINKNLSVREAERQAILLNSGNRTKEKKSSEEKAVRKKSPELEHFEQKLVEALGTKVVVKGNEKKGKIEIEYYSSEDLEQIYNRISGTGR